MKNIVQIAVFWALVVLTTGGKTQARPILLDTLPYRLYPEVNDHFPRLASPFTTTDQQEFIIAVTRHRWENISRFYYNGKQIYVDAEDTKGGQKSIFNDNIEGGFHITLQREMNEQEAHWLEEKYAHLSPEKFKRLKKSLTTINTVEIEPQYIMRYGFYEGHTYWRTDPIAIASIFGLKSLQAIEKAFPGKLYPKLTQPFYSSKTQKRINQLPTLIEQ